MTPRSSSIQNNRTHAQWTHRDSNQSLSTEKGVRKLWPMSTWEPGVFTTQGCLFEGRDIWPASAQKAGTMWVIAGGVHTICMARPCRLPQTHVYLHQSAVCPPWHHHGGHFYPEPASSVNPGNLSGEDVACTLRESPYGHLLGFVHTGLINHHQKLFWHCAVLRYA